MKQKTAIRQLIEKLEWRIKAYTDFNNGEKDVSSMLALQDAKAEIEKIKMNADSVARDASINFADYLKDNRWRLSIETGNWERTFSHCAPEIKTTAELYIIFLEYQPK